MAKTETKNELSFNEKIIQIQNKLKAPKSQYNGFGKYNYRNCEDILEAVKPLLKEYGLLLTLSDSVKEIASILFVEATVLISDGKNELIVSASAGIDINKKGMDTSQTFGASSSYARKYALNGAFLIDDTKDSDATSTTVKKVEDIDVNEAKTVTPDKPWLTEPQLQSTLSGTKEQAQKVVYKFKMKKDYREQIKQKFNF